MTTDIVFYPHAVRASLVSDGTELMCLTLLDDVQPSNNFQDLTSFCAAQVGPQQTGSHMASPDNRFSTPQLGTLLPPLIAGDYCVSRDLSLYNVDTWYRAGANLGMRVANATAAHLRLRMQANAMLCLESITAEEGQLATARCRLAAVLNSQTGADPLVPTASTALAGTASGGRIYTLGPATVNGTLLKGVNSATLDNNLVYDEESSEGDGFLTYIGIKNYAPRLTFRTRKTEYLATYGSRGTALSSLTWYLRSKLASGINEADASLFHIKLTATTGTIKARQASGDKGLVEVTIDLAQSAENTAAYALAVNQAIT